MCKLTLCKIIKCVCLIFLSCNRILNCISAIIKLAYSCIMSSCYIISTYIKASFKKRFPFDISVAGDTRIRSSSPLVFINKIINDLIFEHILKIHHIKINTELITHTSCVLNRTFRTTALMLHITAVRIRPKTHSRTDYVVSLLL